MKEHLATEDHLKDICVYCGRSMEEKTWHTIHSREVLYKVSDCDCGKRAMIRMPFFGSGHDSWSKHSIVLDKHRGSETKLRTLEHKIKVISGDKK